MVLATRRLVQNLDALAVANMRTLEMKISDAGPEHQRIDPHVLTKAKAALYKAGHIVRVDNIWFHRYNESKERVAAKLAQLRPIYTSINTHNFKLRMGQTLEIAILKGLEKSNLEFLGGFTDLEDHNDQTLYKKEEPPLRFSGKRMPGDKRFDFLAFHPTAGSIGIEAKNIREWLYTDRDEVKDLIVKAVVSDSVPVLIARRIPYVTRRLLDPCGVMLFETYNQLYPNADSELAARAKQRDLLGYHDIRIGNDPNPHLLKFAGQSIYELADEYRSRFNDHKDLLLSFATNETYYAAFAARIRRRQAGQPEDADDNIEAEDPNDYGA